MAEIKLTTKKPPSFYVRAAKAFLQGTKDKDAVDELLISALGSAIGAAAAVASQMEKEGLGEVVAVKTDYLQMQSAASPRLSVRVRRTGRLTSPPAGDALGAQGAASGLAIPTAAVPGVGRFEMQGERSYMEDRAVACALPGLDGAVFAGVYDGHVGEKAAEFCAARLHEALGARLLAGCAGDCKAALAGAFRETNEAFLRESGDDTSGTTACVALRAGGVLYTANAGDSRCVLQAAEGPRQLTRDHRPDDADEYARIEGEGGELFDPEDGYGSRVCGPECAMLACSRSIGDRHFKPVVTCDPETSERQIAAGDKFVILASDGVWDEMSNLNACTLVSETLESGSPQDAASALCEAAHKKGSEDNISAVVIVLDG